MKKTLFILVAAFFLGGVQAASRNSVAAAARITARELEYLVLLCRWPEPTLAQIAEHMRLSAKTVEKHRDKLKRKLGAHTTLELFMKAVQQGLVPCCCKRLGTSAHGAAPPLGEE